MKRMADPVHFFDSAGQSLLTIGHQSEIIDRLVEENTELKRLLRNAMHRLRADAEEASRALVN
jgi:hypothetical protein